MKKTKRLVAVLLAVLLLASTLSVPASAKGFSDIYREPEDLLDAVNYVSDNGIIVGEDDGKFYPNNAVTRCQVIAILWRLEGRPYASSYNKFTDVSPDDYFAPAVTWGVNNRIVAGKSDTTFAPHESVSRQDAITFFYRYATRLSGHNPYGRTKSISGCSDYSQVDSYATEAMRWGLGSDLIQLAGNSLSPKRAMTRGEFAKAVTNYGFNVKRIVNGKDNFSFSNANLSNFSNLVYMNNNHRSQFHLVARKYMNKTLCEDFLNTLDDGLFDQNGLCYGMVATEILDKLGKIAFNENFGGASDMHSAYCFPGSNVESAITYYQLSQYFIGYGSYYGLKNAMNACINSTGPVLLTYGFSGEEGNHVILVNSCKKNGSVYEMEVYNPNCPGMIKATLTPINESTGDLKYTGYSQDNATITAIKAMTDFSDFDKIDIDGYQNNNGGGGGRSASLEAGKPDAASSSVGDDDVESILLNITLHGPFHLENAEGEFLDWDGAELTGTMNWNIEPSPIFTSSHLLLYVPVTEALTFTPQTDEATMSVSSNSQWSYIDGTGITLAKVENGHISLEGDSMDFTSILRINDNVASTYADSTLPGVRLDAHAEETVTLTASATNYTAQGISGEYTLQTLYSTDEILTKVEDVAEPGEVISQPISES